METLVKMTTGGEGGGLMFKDVLGRIFFCFIITRLALFSVLGLFGVHLLKFTLPLEFPVRVCDSHITTHKRPT